MCRVARRGWGVVSRGRAAGRRGAANARRANCRRSPRLRCATAAPSPPCGACRSSPSRSTTPSSRCCPRRRRSTTSASSSPSSGGAWPQWGLGPLGLLTAAPANVFVFKRARTVHPSAGHPVPSRAATEAHVPPDFATLGRFPPPPALASLPRRMPYHLGRETWHSYDTKTAWFWQVRVCAPTLLGWAVGNASRPPARLLSPPVTCILHCRIPHLPRRRPPSPGRRSARALA